MSEKIRNIEGLRFLFILLIIAYHINQGITNPFRDIEIYNTFIKNTHMAWLVADFFFIISGFFLFKTTDFSKNFMDFAIHKLKRLMPAVIVVLLIAYIVCLNTPINWIKHENLFTILNIQNIGLTNKAGNVQPSWYVSSLFWAMCFYFYLYKSVSKNIFNLFTACLTAICYSIFTHVPNQWNLAHYHYYINMGMVRALAGIGAGYFIYLFYENYKSTINSAFNSIKAKIILSLLEIYSLVTIVYYLGFHKLTYYNLLYFIVLFIILFITFLINKGIVSKCFDNNFSVFIGKYTYCIFLIHNLLKDLWCWRFCVNHPVFIHIHPILHIVMFYIFVILSGVLLYHFADKPIRKYLDRKKVS